MTLPLEGVRVLDLTHVLAGPFCTYQLSLLGAEVIKIEMPGRGDLARSLGANVQTASKGMGSSFVAVNAGKQSITLDIKCNEGKTILKRMVSESDVLVENFRPGVMKRLGLDFETLSAIRASLVYCSISGFGQSGPMAQRPAYDQIIQGISGAMSITGSDTSAPLRVGYPVADTVGGLTASFAIVSALFGAQKSGRGTYIDVSMLESVLASMGWIVSDFLNAGIDPLPRGNDNFTAAPSGTFRTGDGLLNIAANEDRQYAALCRALDRADLLVDPRFIDRHIRKNHREALTVELEHSLATRPAKEWESRLNEAGVPAGLVMTVPQILRHPQIRDNQFVSQLNSPTGEQWVTRCGFRFTGDLIEPTSPAPELSQHTEKWLQYLGYSTEDIHRLRQDHVI